MIDPALAFRTLQTRLQDDGRIVADWRVPLDLPYFRGHFPGSPIFPAVGIVDATLQALRTQLNNPSLQLAGIPMAKFLNPIVPGIDVTLKLESHVTGEWDAEWKGADGKLLASLRLSCRTPQ